MDNENIIDLGKWSCPSSWDDITLKKFQELERYYSGKDKEFDAREVIHILCDKTIDEVNALPMEFTEKILTNLLFLQERPIEEKANNKVVIDGEEYSINYMEKLKTGEYIAVDSVLKSDKHNYAAILGILCRKKDETYDSKFENEVLEERIRMWENVPMMKVMPLVSFFLQLYITLQAPTLLSSEAQEGINLIRENIQNSVKNGEISKRSMRSVMKKLRKLEKCINSI